MAASNFFLLATIMLALTSTCLAADAASAKAAAQVAQAVSQDALNVAKSFESGGNKGKVDECIEVISDAIDNLSQCIHLLSGPINRGIISDVQTKGSAALTDVSTCDDDFGSSEPPTLKQSSANAQKLISSFLAIVNSLN